MSELKDILSEKEVKSLQKPDIKTQKSESK
jgi:hypothetical protein